MRPKGLTSARIKEALGPVWWLLPLCAQLGAKRRADDVAKGGTTVDDRAVSRAVRSGSHRDRFRGVVRGLCNGSVLFSASGSSQAGHRLWDGWGASRGRQEAAKRTRLKMDRAESRRSDQEMCWAWSMLMSPDVR